MIASLARVRGRRAPDAARHEVARPPRLRRSSRCVPAAVFVLLLTWMPGVLAGDARRRVSCRGSRSSTSRCRFRLDALALLLALIVTGVGALVLLYCMHYFADDEPALGRFAALLLAFAGVMLGLVTADDVFLLFTFWEATSVLSYLLIGHYTGRKESRGAALQALTVTTFGGLAMLVGLVVLVVAGGTSSLAELIAHPVTGAAGEWGIALVLVGAISKSALVPFHFWLPAAMAAPTPVSRVPARRRDGEGGRLPRGAPRPRLRRPRRVASDRHRPRACSPCSSAAGARCASTTSSCCSPTAPSASSASSCSSPGYGTRDAALAGVDAPARARAVQGVAVPRRRHRRPRGGHARLAQALGARPTHAGDRDDRVRRRRLDGGPAAAARLRREGGRVHRVPRGRGRGRALGVDRAGRARSSARCSRSPTPCASCGARSSREGGRRADARCTPASRAIGVGARPALRGEPRRSRSRSRSSSRCSPPTPTTLPGPRGVPPRALARPRAGPLASRSRSSRSARCSCGAASGSPACRRPCRPWSTPPAATSASSRSSTGSPRPSPPRSSTAACPATSRSSWPCSSAASARHPS